MFKWIAGLVVVIMVACGGVFAYASSKPVVLADGLSVAGVPVGGLSPQAARDKLTKAPQPAADTLTIGSKTYTLDPKKYGVTSNREQLLQAAIKRAENRSSLDRLMGNETAAAQKEAVRLNDKAVSRFVTNIAKKQRRAAKDAQFNLTARGPRMIEAVAGKQLKQAGLRDQLNAALVKPGSQTVSGSIKTVDAKVKTKADLAKRYPSSVIVDRNAKRARLYRGMKYVKTYPIAIGSAGHESPSGRYAIEAKETNPYWHVPQSAWAGSLAGKTIPPGPQNPIKARWMAIVNGVGFHGTSDDASIGSAASHGCFRMHIPDVIDLYDRVEVGTPVLIL